MSENDKKDSDKAAIKEIILAVVEVLDDNIPILGKLVMDTPAVDALERKCVSDIVDAVYKNMECSLKNDVAFMSWSA